ncbi:MAG TPA: hypothetical protein VHC69_25780 [Polyangiaceae bacterium]|nr:hypothetical protein [Polyangiaceae bacterium]
MKRIIPMLAMLAVALTRRPAHALTVGMQSTFSSHCVNDGSWTYIPVNIDTYQSNMTQKNQRPTQYNELENRMSYMFVWNANSVTDRVQLFFSTFGLEQNSDWVHFSSVLQVDKSGNQFNGSLDATGFLNGVVLTIDQPGGGYMQGMGTSMWLETDDWNKNPSLGYTINRVATSAPCYHNSAGAVPMPQPLSTDGTVYIGVLQAPGDTIYYSLPAEGGASSGRHDAVVAMWRDPDTDGVDFDLYARCNQLPTGANNGWNWDVAGLNGASLKTQATAEMYGSSEFLYLPESKCKNGTWFIAANSFSAMNPSWNVNNAGVYYLHANYVNDHRPSLNSTMTDSTMIGSVAASLNDGMHAFFGATDMSMSFAGATMYDQSPRSQTYSSAGSMQIFFQNVAGRSENWWTVSLSSANNKPPNVSPETSVIYIYQDCLGGAPECMAHEFSHWEFGLPDEYVDYNGKSYAQCGHSLMALNWFPYLDSYCVGHVVNHNNVPDNDHNTDYPLPDPVPINGAYGTAAWPGKVNSRVGYIPKYTPITYDFTYNPLLYWTSDGIRHSFINITLAQ